MGYIDKNRKFKRKVNQKQPTNPKINNAEINKFDIDNKTIKEQQNKK